MCTLSADILMQLTRKWIKTVVVDLEFCPFAGRVLEDDRLRMRVLKGATRESVCETMLEELRHLDHDESTETTLLILANGHHDFEAYLLLVGHVEALLESEGYEGVYQLASFHPDYCFVDSPPEDAANYTNRSPFPMIHVLRASSVEVAIENHPDTEAIPRRNIEAARKLGADRLKALLDQCWIDEAGGSRD